MNINYTNNKKLKNLILPILLILLFTVSGCKGGSSFKFGKSPTTDSSKVKEKVFTGTEGLEFEFLKNLPPDEIFDTTNLQVIAEIRNLGTEEVVGADFFLTGFDPNIVQGIDAVKEIGRIEGKSQFLIGGGIDNIRFESTNIRLPKGTDEYSPELILTTCYEYRTYANPIVCIDPNKQNPAIDETGACEEGSVSVSGGQGAPMAVTNVDVDSTSDTVFFRIEIRNAGGGKVVDERVSRSRKCPFDLDFGDIDEVSYDVKLSGFTPIKCSPLVDGFQKVKLSDNTATITCEFDIPSQNKFAFTTPLQVTLDYGYTESTSSKKVRIYKTGR